MKTARSKEHNKYWREENILERRLRLEREGGKRDQTERGEKSDNALREREERRAKEKSE